MRVECPGCLQPLYENNQLTEYGVRTFTEGHCWMFAWAVHTSPSLRNTRIYTVGPRQVWNHVTTRIGTTQSGEPVFFDAYGIQTLTQVQTRWRQAAEPIPTVAHTDLDAYESHIGFSWFFDSDLHETTLIAHHMIQLALNAIV